MSGYRLLRGTAREKLQVVRAGSVRTCITSPPYWGLRDYEVEPEVWTSHLDQIDILAGHSPSPCREHQWGPWGGYTGHREGMGSWTEGRPVEVGQPNPGEGENQRTCLRCGAWEGPLGLEPTPDMYIAHLVECFEGVWRTLADDGTLWIVIGDTYARRVRSGGPKVSEKNTLGTNSRSGVHAVGKGRGPTPRRATMGPGLKQGDLVGIPWMLAFALRDAGWYLRAENIWGKPNGMPESVRTRTTRVHEQIFTLSKRERYYYDHEAIKEPAVSGHPSGNGFKRAHRISVGGRGNEEQWKPTKLRNKRSVWMVNTRQYKDAHFAVFPHGIVEPCLLAGSAPGDVVLDPFVGTGTTGEVAAKHGRRFVGIELNEGYADMCEKNLSEAYNRDRIMA